MKRLLAFLLILPTITLAMDKPWIPSFVSNFFKSNEQLATQELVSIIKELPYGEAVAQEKLAQIENLLKKGANPNTILTPGFKLEDQHGSYIAAKWPLLTLAARKNLPQIVELLLKNGGRPNEINGIADIPPLLEAISGCNENMIRLLLKYGADINIQLPIDGQNPLIAAHNCPNKIWHLLLESGANPNLRIQVKENVTVLMYLCSLHAGLSDSEHEIAKREEIRKKIKLLLEYGADPDLQDDNGKNALIWLTDLSRANSGTGVVTKILLDHGANPNVQSNKGNTALILASARGDSPTVSYLLRAGANPLLTNKEGETALSFPQKLLTRFKKNQTPFFEEGISQRNIESIIENLQNPQNVTQTWPMKNLPLLRKIE